MSSAPNSDPDRPSDSGGDATSGSRSRSRTSLSRKRHRALRELGWRGQHSLRWRRASRPDDPDPVLPVAEGLSLLVDLDEWA